MAMLPFLHLPSPTEFSTFPQVTGYIRRMYESLQATRKGKLECVVEVTLTANAASTTVSDIRLSSYSAILFDPLTANAAAELAAGTLYATTANRGDSTVTLTHANAATTDRSYRMVVIG